tara:strand:+ start:1105 stop:1695 length:591 start_codon:yes stop_codon:yes gene_type:complete
MEKDNSSIERVHRGMSSSLLWLTLLFFFIMMGMIVSLQISLASLIGILSIGMMVGLITIYFGFNNRRPWAYKFAMAHWLFLILICILIGIQNLLVGVSGDILALVMSGMLIFISVGMIKRFSTFSNPIFIAWYLGKTNKIIATTNLDENEMMGACPNCLSLLAVKPLELHHEDKCPNCNMKLVSDETYHKFANEEE